MVVFFVSLQVWVLRINLLELLIVVVVDVDVSFVRNIRNLPGCCWYLVFDVWSRKLSDLLLANGNFWVQLLLCNYMLILS